MNQTDVKLVKQVMDKVSPYANDFFESFYKTLFANNPNIKALFASAAGNKSNSFSLEQQAKHFYEMINFIVDNLAQPQKIADSIKSLGQRHKEYNVAPEHYDAMMASLLASFAQFLGNEFDDHHRQAWIKAYVGLTSTMLEGYNYPPPTKATISSSSPSANICSE